MWFRARFQVFLWLPESLELELERSEVLETEDEDPLLEVEEEELRSR